MSQENAVKLIKKYPNRRLYDTQTSHYVTLADITEMVLAETELRIVDARSGKDLTRNVLMQIITEREAHEDQPLMSVSVLREVIRLYSNEPLNRLFFDYIGEALTNFLRRQKALHEQTNDLFESLSPVDLGSGKNDQQARMWKAMMQVLTWSPAVRGEIPPARTARRTQETLAEPENGQPSAVSGRPVAVDSAASPGRDPDDPVIALLRQISDDLRQLTDRVGALEQSAKKQ